MISVYQIERRHAHTALQIVSTEQYCRVRLKQDTKSFEGFQSFLKLLELFVAVDIFDIIFVKKNGRKKRKQRNCGRY